MAQLPRRFLSVSLNVSLLLGSLLFALVVAECFVRLFVRVPVRAHKEGWVGAPTKSYAHELTPYNLRLRYKPTPKASHNAENVMNRFNSDGFRDKDYSIEKPPNVVRMIFLGDSVVYGHAVELHESLPKQLEKMYNRNGKTVEVLNLGVSGYDTEQEVEFLKEIGLKYKPDLVLVGYCLNDVTYSSFEMDWFHAKENAKIKHDSKKLYKKVLGYLYRHLELLQHLDQRFRLQERFKIFRSYSESTIYHYVMERNKKNQDEAGSPYRTLKEKIISDAKQLGTSKASLKHILPNIGFGPNQDLGAPHWNVTREAFVELKALAQERGFNLVVVIFPFLQEMDRYPLESLHEFLRSEFESLDLATIDMMEWGKDIHVRYERSDISKDAFHFTPLSNSLAAKFLYDHIPLPDPK